ncbi:hypothetical protein D2N39_11420 [Gemmobacter lutimaris]|uniref:Uncharacterized protein n=1 Tax=Gemmobacter lutimaris TaxID=2306023 RepID=A0A398BVD5_9RHOB|nr:hypothetical protein [Gemmobacter lutimaris]RID91840.1 hypothetical protein D2N39_11420 [Gemmobacter lutimaris]
MAQSDEDLLGIAGGKYPAQRKATRNSGDLGQLHALLRRGLPDFTHDGIFEAKRFARTIGVSYQAIYKWFDRERISPNRVARIIELSEETTEWPEGFVPLKRDDFWPFMGNADSRAI